MNDAERAGMVEAEKQNGLITRAEARGFLRARQLKSRLEEGAWAPVFPSVYRVAGAPITWHQQLEALLLWGGKKRLGAPGRITCAISHRSAAALHGFKLFKEGPLELTMTRQLRPLDGVKIHRVKSLPHGDLVELDGYDVTSVTRTLIDLAATTDPFTLRTVFDQALREKTTTLEQLERAVSRSKNRPGVIDARNLLRELSGADGPTESELEDAAVELIQAAGLPKPRVQWSLIAGRKRRRLDLFFETEGVVVEADGYASHSGVEAFEDDRERNNSLTVGGFTVLHWTWRAIHERAEGLITELIVALNLRH